MGSPAKKKKVISTDLQVKNESEPGRHKVSNGDGYKGLFLVVRPGGQKSWMYRYQLNKSRIDMGLGRYPQVYLKEARDKHIDASRQVHVKQHPSGPQAVAKIPTFRQAAASYIKKNQASWSNTKHTNQWPNSLRDHVHPFIGDMLVDQIESVDIIKALAPIWISHQETAGRVRSRIELILDDAYLMNDIKRANPAPLKVLKGGLPIITRSNKHETVHHPALPYADLPAFMVDLAERTAPTARALEFAILTAARPGEVRRLEWSDIDGAIWTIPKEKYKTHKMHQVPLSVEAQAILDGIPKVGNYVFGDSVNPLSENAMLALIGRMGLKGVASAHGMRSSFKDWSEDSLKYPHKVSEAALGHKVKGQTVQAYLRTTFFDRRIDLMQDWAGYVSTAFKRSKLRVVK